MTTAMAPDVTAKRGAEDSGPYFRYMAEFVGFTRQDADAIKESGLIIEKYLPEIVAQFYTHLLRYPPTRGHFLRPDGTIDQEYLQLRMHHLTNFWRRTASGEYDDGYAQYVDYVGRAHTNHGADPKIYIAERYVIGQVGFVQHAISQALTKELHEIDPDLEVRALRAWNLLMMVILEMLSRAYADEREVEPHGTLANINHQTVFSLAVETYELGLGMRMPIGTKDIVVGAVDEIPEGERKIIQVDELSIGVFHHQGRWYALRNSCLHQRGPVCTGTLKGDILTCPWHGFQYNVTTGQFLADPSAKLASYPVQIRDGLVVLQIPIIPKEVLDRPISEGQVGREEQEHTLKKNEFYVRELAPGQVKLVHVGNPLGLPRGTDPVAVYNVGGTFYATQSECTHANGPLEQGDLDGRIITCPLHDSRFDVTTGQVIEGPADEPLKTFRVIVESEIGRVERP